jgi:hypothetical protein
MRVDVGRTHAFVDNYVTIPFLCYTEYVITIDCLSYNVANFPSSELPLLRFIFQL